MNDIIKKHVVTFGLIAGGISAGYTLIAYLIDQELFVNWWAGIVLWVVTLTVMVLAVSRIKKEQSGYISFKEGFTSFFLTWAICAVIGVVMNLLLFTVIDPGAAEGIREMAIEAQIEMFEGFGMSDEDMLEQIERVENMDQFAIGAQLQGLVYSLLFGAVIGLIVAAAFKKNRPEFGEMGEEG